MKVRVLTWMLFILCLLCLFAPSGRAAPAVQIKVKVILASQQAGSVDPRLQGLTRELQSVFRYGSYTLLSEKSMSQSLKNAGVVSLPGGRVMSIAPQSLSGNRVTLKLEINKGKRQIFQTVIQLRNRSSLTVGGPKHKGGYLLFNISASF